MKNVFIQFNVDVNYVLPGWHTYTATGCIQPIKLMARPKKGNLSSCHAVSRGYRA